MGMPAVRWARHKSALRERRPTPSEVPFTLDRPAQATRCTPEMREIRIGTGGARSMPMLSAPQSARDLCTERVPRRAPSAVTAKGAYRRPVRHRRRRRKVVLPEVIRGVHGPATYERQVRGDAANLVFGTGEEVTARHATGAVTRELSLTPFMPAM
jgi:hypothetical protein